MGRGETASRNFSGRMAFASCPCSPGNDDEWLRHHALILRGGGGCGLRVTWPSNLALLGWGRVGGRLGLVGGDESNVQRIWFHVSTVDVHRPIHRAPGRRVHAPEDRRLVEDREEANSHHPPPGPAITKHRYRAPLFSFSFLCYCHIIYCFSCAEKKPRGYLGTRVG